MSNIKLEELYSKASNYVRIKGLRPKQLSVTYSIRNGKYCFSFAYDFTVFNLSNMEMLDKKIEEFFKNGEYKK